MKVKCINCGKEIEIVPEEGDVVYFCDMKCKSEWFENLPSR